MTKLEGQPRKRLGKAAGATLAVAAVLEGMVGISARAADAPVTLDGTDNQQPTPTLVERQMLGCKLTDSTGGGSYHCEKGGAISVIPGDFLIGDVAMRNTSEDKLRFLFDSDNNKGQGVDPDHTGLIVDVQTTGEAVFPYGGDLVAGLTDTRTSWVDLQRATMEATGCVDGCQTVDVVTWTGKESTVDQGQLEKGQMPEATTQPTQEPISEVTVTPITSENDALLKELLALDPSTLTLDQKLALGNLRLQLTNEQLLEEIQKCTCDGDCVHKNPTPSPKPTPEPCPELTTDHVMSLGERFVVPAGHKIIVQADAIIDGKHYHDSKATTGSVNVLTDGKRHVIQTPYGGGDVTIFCPTATNADVKEKYQDVLHALRGTGRTLDKKSVNQLKN